MMTWRIVSFVNILFQKCILNNTSRLHAYAFHKLLKKTKNKQPVQMQTPPYHRNYNLYWIIWWRLRETFFTYFAIKINFFELPNNFLLKALKQKVIKIDQLYGLA